MKTWIKKIDELLSWSYIDLMGFYHSHTLWIASLAINLASSAQADLCRDLDLLGKRAQYPTNDASNLSVASLPAGSKCSTSLGLSGAQSIHCAMGFAYRSDIATTTFEKLVKGTETCIGTAFQSVNDQDVNHPDFYDLRSFKTEDSTISISLKDKGALQMTYVFLRVEARKKP